MSMMERVTADGTDLDQEREYHAAVKRVMVLMMLADGVIYDGEINAIYGVYEWVTGRAISEREVLEEIRDAERSGQSVGDYVGTLKEELDDYGRALIVRASHGIAMADGEVCAQERKLLTQIADAVGLPRDKYREILAGLDGDRWPN